jgi:ectoine hydroxylase-related dioxygenase (phytanoyl-CoA dioxygenase family)
MPLTPEETFHFDVAGFLVRPAVLTADEVARLRDQVERIYFQPDTLPPQARQLPGGPASMLIDHPAIVDAVEALVGPNLRMETSEPMWRKKGEAFYRPFHRGSPYQSDPIFGYRAEAGRMFLAMVRVIVELTEVRRGMGGTSFIVGSHKANFPLPEQYRVPGVRPDGDLVVDYECPPGSVVIFTEGVAHTGLVWQDDEPRIAIFNTYSNPAVRYHRPSFSPEVLAALPPEKRAYFRPVWYMDQDADPPRFNTMDEFLRVPEPLSGQENGGGLPADLRLRRQSVKPS